MELIEQLNVIEVGLLSGIMMLIVIFGIVIYSKLKAIDKGLAYARVSESKKAFETAIKTIPSSEETEPIKLKEFAPPSPTEPIKVKIELPKPQPVQEVPIQEQLKKVIPRTESVSAKGTCDWCGNEYSNLPVHRRFCKSKPPAT